VKQKLINVPNLLTVCRMIMTILLLRFLFIPSLVYRVIAVILYVLAVLTDYLDGVIARKYHLITDFGKIADPIADKFLILGLFIAFSKLDMYSFAWLVPIIIREVLVTLLRLVFLFRGCVIAAEKMGKYKVGFQVACLCFAWIFLFVREYGADTMMFAYLDHLNALVFFTLFCSIILTVYSGIAFLIANNKSIAELGFARVIAVFFGCGLSPVMPGTVGTIGGVVLYYFIHSHSFYLTILLSILVMGTWSAGYISSERGKEDPQEIVIDEVAGYLITMLFVPFSWLAMVLGFILFRFFDILKPGPVSYVERAPRGYGIMLDDILAGVFANIVLQVLVRMILF
jgi:phosphatidylglycerophosphatase A